MQNLPALCLLALLVCGSAAPSPAQMRERHGRKYKAPPPMGQVTVTVLRAEDGRPLENAAVIFHPQTETGKDDGNMELKTKPDGTATLNLIPIGSKLLVQVIDPGYRTFGQQYNVPSDTNSIVIRLVPPTGQYSVYGKKTGGSDVLTNTPQTQMGTAAPADSPLLTDPGKKKEE